MYSKSNNCGYCFTPTKRRLALVETRDEFECYAERYVKCFWGLCDQHKSVHCLTNKTDATVITQQPVRQELPLQSTGITPSILVTN